MNGKKSRFLMVIFIFLIVFLGAVWGIEADNPDKLLRDGELLLKQGNLKSAGQKFQAGLKICESPTLEKEKCKFLAGLGLVHTCYVEFAPAMEYYEESLVLAKKYHDKKTQEKVLWGMGIINMVLAQNETALKYFSESMTISKEINNKAGEGLSLIYIGRIYLRTGEEKRGLEYMESALKIVEDMADEQLEGEYYLNLGIIYYSHIAEKDPLTYLEKALEIFNKNSMKYKEMTCYYCMTEYYLLKTKNNSKAIECLEKAYTLAKDMDIKSLQQIYSQQIGNLYNNTGLYKMGISYLEKSLLLAQELKDEGRQYMILKDLGIYSQKLGQFGKSIEYLEKVLQIARNQNNEPHEALYQITLGYSLQGMGEYDKALESFQNSLKIYKKLNNKPMQLSVMGDMGYNYTLMGKDEEGLKIYKEALEIARQDKNTPVEIAYLIQLGNYYSKKDEKEGLKYLQSALTLSQKTGDKINEINILYFMGELYYFYFKFRESLACYEKALKVCQETGDKTQECDMWGQMGWASMELYEYEKSREYFNKALEIARQIQDKNLEMKWTGKLGDSYYTLGKYQNAMKHLDLAISLARELGNEEREIYYLLNLGMIYINLNQIPRGYEYYDKAINIAKKSGRNDLILMPLMCKGHIFNLVFQDDKALKIYQEGLEIAKKLKYTKDEIMFLNYLGNCHIWKNQPDQAEKILLEALQLAEKNGDKKSVLFIHQSLAWIKEITEKYPEALNGYEETLKIAKELDVKWMESSTLIHKGTIYRYTGNYNQALKCLEPALKIAREIQNRDMEQVALWEMGTCYLFMGKDKEALKYLDEALYVLEEMRNEIKLEDLKRNFFEFRDSMELFNVLIKLALFKQKDPAKALEYAERGRARNFLDMLGNRHVTPKNSQNEELLLQERELSSKIKNMEKTLISRQDKSLSGQLKQAREDYKDTLRKIKVSDPEYADMISVFPKKVSEIQNCINKDEVIIEYFIGNFDSYVWVVSGESVKCYTVDATKKDLDSRLSAMKQLLIPSPSVFMDSSLQKQNRHELDAKSQELYRILIKPLEQDIQGKTQLVIIPHGNLHFLPFSALMDDEGKYLIEKYTILTNPSASSLAIFREKQRKNLPDKFTGFAYGNIKKTSLEEMAEKGENMNPGLIPDSIRGLGMDPLPGTEEEVKKIAQDFTDISRPAKVFINEDFTLKNIEKELPSAGYIHFATHGFVMGSKDTADFSGIVTSQEFIYILDVFNWDLNARLVVLSACQTGLGSISQGDDMVGLSRAFMYAGADNLIATLWSVSDDSTRELMVNMYKFLLSHNELSVPQALRQAQIKLIKDEKYTHPYFWSPFVVYGK